MPLSVENKENSFEMKVCPQTSKAKRKGLSTKVTTNPGTGKILKILHLEDLQSDILLVANALKRGGIVYEGLVVEGRDKFKKALKKFSPDIILADHALPSFSSTEALAILQKTRCKIPFILITAAMSDEFAVNIIKNGADDYILKDRLNRLPSAIHNSLEKIRLEKERLLYLDELEKKENRFHTLVENSADAVVIFDAGRKPIYASYRYLSTERIRQKKNLIFKST